MDAITQSGQVEVTTERPSKEKAAGSRTYPSGGSGNTTLTRQDIERLERLSRSEALAEVHEQLASLLVLWKNLGGKIVGITLPEGKEILAQRHILVLPARKDEFGVFSLDVPE